mgnify:CR=1 FL=1
MGLLMDQQQAQKTFNILIEALKDAIGPNLHYLCRDFLTGTIENPLDAYLKRVKEQLNSEGLPYEGNENVLKEVYNNAFYTGEIPENRNHIRMTADITVAKKDASFLVYWIDLDKVAELTKEYLSLDSSCNFEYKSWRSMGGEYYSRDVIMHWNHAANSYYGDWDRSFILAAFMLAISFILYIIPLGVPLIFPLGVMVLAAAVIFSNGLLYCDAPLYTKPIPSDSQALNSIDLVKTFKEHFNDTIYKTPSDNHGNDHDGELEIIPELEDETSTNSSGASNS